MSVRKLTARIFGSLVLLCGMASAQAQQHAPIVADPLAFDPDFRWFEPIYDMDIADMKPKKRANTGWFATYDRLNLYASRPETEDPNSAESNLDSGWGHRYEVGFMLPDEDTGMLFSWTTALVDEGFRERNFRLNLLNEDELNQGATNPGAPFGREALPFFSNNFGYNYRFVDEIQTLNTVDFDSYELSKTWRLEPYHYGGMLEPMLGVRWFRIDDVNQRQDYRNTDDPADALLGTQSLATLFGADVEQLTTNRAITDNEALTAQAGFRYFKYRDRFMFSTDFRVFAGGNFQNSQSDRLVETLIYDGTDVAIEGASSGAS